MDQEKVSQNNSSKEKVTYLGGDPEERAKADKALKEICSDGNVSYVVSSDQTHCFLYAKAVGEAEKAAERYNELIGCRYDNKETGNESVELTTKESEENGSSHVANHGNKNNEEEKEENENDTHIAEEAELFHANTKVKTVKPPESETDEEKSNIQNRGENQSIKRNSASDKRSSTSTLRSPDIPVFLYIKRVRERDIQ
ncbi:myb-like protein X [Saccostrea cucullata]|uniref:myb-like protein X n=1 Tax=Saccostrea cuccullata TaxID=36930 RepID=UPI002ED36385